MAISSRRQIQDLASRGKFLEADEALLRNQSIKQERQLIKRKKLEEEQALQWQALSRAKHKIFTNAYLESAIQQEAKRADLRKKFLEDRTAHAEELEAYTLREAEVIMRRPVAQSMQTVEMKKESKLYAIQNRFREADASYKEAARSDAETVRLAMKERQRLLGEKVAACSSIHREKERSAQKHMRSRMVLEQLKSQRELDCMVSRLDHMTSGMAAAHARQRKGLQKLGFVPNTSVAQYFEAHRGTLLEGQVFGSQHGTPPMCEMYAHMLDEAPSVLPSPS